jgi:hypothetical protein
VYEEIPDQGDFNNQDITIAVDSQNSLIVVWKAGTEVIYRKRLENGTWNTPIVVGSVAGRTCEHPSVAVDSSDTAHIVWKEDYSASTEDIRYNTVSVTGVLGTQLNVTNLVTRRQIEPYIAIGCNNVAHIVWQGTGWGTNRTYYNIQYNTVTDGVLGTQIGITDKAVTSGNPECAIDSNGFVHLIYYEASGLGTQGLYYTNNTAGTFGTPTRLTTFSSNSGLSITLDAKDNIYAFCATPTLPQGSITILSNKGDGWATTMVKPMAYQYCDVYSMWSWYPRFGIISPNILDNGYLAYLFWPKPTNYAYLMLRAPSQHPTIPTEPNRGKIVASL